MERQIIYEGQSKNTRTMLLFISFFLFFFSFFFTKFIILSKILNTTTESLPFKNGYAIYIQMIYSVWAFILLPSVLQHKILQPFFLRDVVQRQLCAVLVRSTWIVNWFFFYKWSKYYVIIQQMKWRNICKKL